MTLRLIFMGTPDFAVPSLKALADAGHEVVCAYSQPPRPAGRGQKERRQPVHAAAEALGIPVRTPTSLKSDESQAEFAALKADVAVVAAYGLILPKPILDAPRLGCLNIHASLLPRWRGAAPIQRAILAGDDETGVTIMQMDEGLDTGPMLHKHAVKIERMTAGDLHDELADLGAAMIVEALDRLEAGALRAKPQPKRGVKYAPKIEKAESKIDWTRSASEIGRQVRAFTPYPGAWFEHAGERIRVLAAKPTGGQSKAKPGTVIDDALTVACGKGLLKLHTVQRAGKGATDVEAFLRGYAIPKGTVLG